MQGGQRDFRSHSGARADADKGDVQLDIERCFRWYLRKRDPTVSEYHQRENPGSMVSKRAISLSCMKVVSFTTALSQRQPVSFTLAFRVDFAGASGQGRPFRHKCEAWRRASTFRNADCGFDYWTTSSTRRFLARPASSAFEATGARLATPLLARRAAGIWYCLANAATTACARCCDNVWLASRLP